MLTPTEDSDKQLTSTYTVHCITKLCLSVNRKFPEMLTPHPFHVPIALPRIYPFEPKARCLYPLVTKIWLGIPHIQGIQTIQMIDPAPHLLNNH
jgi:hypothetical protein